MSVSLPMIGPVVVVGGGHAGFQTVASLRENGFTGPLSLISEENTLPYERPPLSKKLPAAADDHTELRPASFYDSHGVEVRVGEPAVAVDRRLRTVELGSGRRLDYDHLVLAVGAEPVPLPTLNRPLDGVLTLRTALDAARIRARLSSRSRMVVVGGGFLGLEVAASAAQTGASVCVVEAADRVLARVVSPLISRFLEQEHLSHGVTVLTETLVAGLLDEDGHVTGVRLADGRELGADLVVVAIGVRPRTGLALAAGLAVADDCGGGIVVDQYLRTTDPAISAIGDCANFPGALPGGGRTRLESVQNAVDQGRFVAARLMGVQPGAYDALPWFWTHQFDVKIQIAGLAGPETELRLLGDPSAGRFSVARLVDDRLVSVESVNSPADHIAARKLLGTAAVPSGARDLARPGFTLPSHAREAAEARRATAGQ